MIEQLTQDAIATESDYSSATQRLSDPKLVRLLHVGMTLVTESAEFVDMLKKHIYYGKPLDMVNLKEELGDVSWGLRVGSDALGETLLAILERNRDKLKARYPDKFTEERAINRDVAAERKILENECA